MVFRVVSLIKYLPLVTLGLLLSAALQADTPTVDQQRRMELAYLLKHDCGSCHGMQLKGGLGPPLLPKNLENKPDLYLKHVISQGMPGTAMPPWGPLLSEADIDYLVYLLTHQEGSAREEEK